MLLFSVCIVGCDHCLRVRIVCVRDFCYVVCVFVLLGGFSVAVAVFCGVLFVCFCVFDCCIVCALFVLMCVRVCCVA